MNELKRVGRAFRERNPHLDRDADFRTACPTFSLYGFGDMLSGNCTLQHQLTPQA